MEDCRRTLGYAKKTNSPVLQKESLWPALIFSLHNALLQILVGLEASLLSYSLTQNQKCVIPKQVKCFQVTYPIQAGVCTGVRNSLSVEISTAGVMRAGVRAPFGPLTAFCTVVFVFGDGRKALQRCTAASDCTHSTSFYSSSLLSV